MVLYMAHVFHPTTGECEHDFALCALLVSAASVNADVYFEEEVVNRGFGKAKTGARKTTHKIYIKGKSPTGRAAD